LRCSFDQTPDPSTYYGVVYPGKVHVTDFFSKPALAPGEYDAFNDGFKMFTDALDEWLPKFSPWSPSSTSDAAAALPTGPWCFDTTHHFLTRSTSQDALR
jgi:hypothetical protein